MSAEKKAIEEMIKAMGVCPMNCDPCDGKCKYFSNTEREKQIKEMAQVLETAKIKALATIGSLNNGFGEWYAKVLYEVGCRKIPEGAVVLTREEFDENYTTKQDRDYWKYKVDICKDRLKQARKETAREIFAKIDKILKRNHICSVLGEIGKLKEQFGVEVEE